MDQTISNDAYMEYLTYVQADHRPKITNFDLENESVHNINLQTRQIDSPQFLSVKHDHKAEIVYFKVDRFFDYMDLSQTVCIVQYITADNKARIYPVPYYDIETCADNEKMLIPWCIDGGATAVAGTIQYSLRFYKVDEEQQKFIYVLNTKPATSKVLYGMDVQNMSADYQITPTAYEYMLQTLAQFHDTLDDFGAQLGGTWVDMY